VSQQKSYNALTPYEEAIVYQMIASKEHADDSCRVLSIEALNTYKVYISHVTFYNKMKQKGINGPRGIYARRKNSSAKPEIGDVTGPNQLWSWDISYIKTTIKYKSYYLYALLDWYSRKIIAWHISEFLNSNEAQILWDNGILSEGLQSDKLPRSLCDRGSQMRSTSTKSFFTALGVQQYFSRPRTPNDNPQIESLFSTVKNSPQYPEHFGSLQEAQRYFEKFFNWYNNEHYHTGIGMVTPVDRPTGKDVEILKQRQQIKEKTMMMRRSYNCQWQTKGLAK
jgi:putative transposase